MNFLFRFLNIVDTKLSRKKKRWVLRILDSFLFLFSIYTAFSLRFDILVSFERIFQHWVLVLLLIPVKIGVFSLMGQYRPILRYAGLEVLSATLKGIVSSTGILAFMGFLLQVPSFPRSVWLIDGILSFLLVVFMRIFMRWLMSLNQLLYRNMNAEKVIIYGAGETGVQLAHAISRDENYRVAAFIDNDGQLQHQVINGVTVYGPNKLSNIIKQQEVKSILVAISSSRGTKRREIIQSLESYSIPIKTIPGMADIVTGKVSLKEIRDIDITDLLGRDEVLPDPSLLETNVKNKSVLVTGAGGSIGSELCRQILQQKPKRLILYERNELALFNIEFELHQQFPGTPCIACLSSTTDSNKLQEVFKKYEVQTVYHAAAYKHVPLVEVNAAEGIRNNVRGTLCPAEEAIRCGVETFVLISSDKAVRPTSVMGSTKRVAELILQAKSKEKHETKFIMVRFGNVLDSTGSVVPRFREQIAKGGPITLTHPDITRYFMSIREAARLVIQAGALGKGGEVFLLDMGEPVKIIDLARQMIKLSGLTEGKDLEIKITGLRPGEKLYEELLIDGNGVTPSSHPKIFFAQETMIPWEHLEKMLETLFRRAEKNQTDLLQTSLKELVPEYHPSN